MAVPEGLLGGARKSRHATVDDGTFSACTQVIASTPARLPSYGMFDYKIARILSNAFGFAPFRLSGRPSSRPKVASASSIHTHTFLCSSTPTVRLLLYVMYESYVFDSLQDTLISSDFHLKLTDFMLFGAVASAVDPVAVLAIFQDLSINKDLYFLVFGESLLNDAVTVALYSAMVTFTGISKIQGAQYGEAVLRLFTAGIGGTLIGMIGGFLTALVTRATRNCRVVEPLAVLGLAYLAYLISELFHFSGIISIIICGLLQAHYAFKNISHKSYTTVKYFTKMISSTSDSAIFLFLGAELVGGLTAWHTTFAVSSIFLCLLCRYASLRGATCYALATMLDPNYPPSDLFSTTALALVLFTVFVQGGTIKYLVQILKIEKLSLIKKTLNEEIMENVCNTMMAGLEEIASARGDYYLKRKLEILDEKYLKKIFLNSDVSNDLKHLFEKISI
ncbi:hypothetical protein B566_EDAN003137, partial [Ephemera danica]